VPDEEIIDDGGPTVVIIESAPEGVNRGALYVRVGPVFHGNIPQGIPGVWVNYQKGYLKTPLESDILFSVDAWRRMVREVEERLREKGVPPPDDII
jgi:hypothetical protein